jgi:hypothetical protein
MGHYNAHSLSWKLPIIQAQRYCQKDASKEAPNYIQRERRLKESQVFPRKASKLKYRKNQIYYGMIHSMPPPLQVITAVGTLVVAGVYFDIGWKSILTPCRLN